MSEINDNKGIWMEVGVVTCPPAVEAVTWMLLELGAEGVVVDEPDLLRKRRQQLGPDLLADDEFLEEAPSPSPGRAAAGATTVTAGGGGGDAEAEVAIVRAYLRPRQLSPPLLQDLAVKVKSLPSFGLPAGEGRVYCREVAEEAWAESWKKYYRPIRAGRRLVVVPSWLSYTPQPEDILLILDPGMAFGTGHHPTTQMCLAELEQVVKPGQRVLDLGTGSGILAIAAAKLGAAQVTAVDISPEAVEVAAENAGRNQVEGAITFLAGTLADISEENRFDVIVANITADVIIALLPGIAARLAPGGRFIASGVIIGKAAAVEQAWSAAGLKMEKCLETDEWVCLVGG
ncbi:MAG TPA: 50S ribosomal protein L11 methyltransferase [Firmicutes bacterium]|nr:50S ribosomal protein L11 methyltransferase [Bacillota bacterium]